MCCTSIWFAFGSSWTILPVILFLFSLQFLRQENCLPHFITKSVQIFNSTFHFYFLSFSWKYSTNRPLASCSHLYWLHFILVAKPSVWDFFYISIPFIFILFFWVSSISSWILWYWLLWIPYLICWRTSNKILSMNVLEYHF